MMILPWPMSLWAYSLTYLVDKLTFEYKRLSISSLDIDIGETFTEFLSSCDFIIICQKENNEMKTCLTQCIVLLCTQMWLISLK